MQKILQKEAPLLREIAREVPTKEIGGTRIKKIISDMKKALDSQDDGVAIAAPQIGHSLRIFIVSKKVEATIKKTDNTPDLFKDLVFINPILKKLSREKESVEEGCLSVRYLYGKVRRSKKALIEAYDEYGKKFTKGASGLLAQIFQHETDHLHGVLFIDKATDLINLPPQKKRHAKV